MGFTQVSFNSKLSLNSSNRISKKTGYKIDLFENKETFFNRK